MKSSDCSFLNANGKSTFLSTEGGTDLPMVKQPGELIAAVSNLFDYLAEGLTEAVLLVTHVKATGQTEFMFRQGEDAKEWQVGVFGLDRLAEKVSPL